MARQHREFHAWLDNVEKLRLYAQSVVTKHQALNASLAKAKSRSKHREREAKAGVKKIAGGEKKRDEAKEEAHVARLAVVVVGDAKVRAKDDLVRIQEALVVVEEARHKVEVKTSRQEVERTSLLLELGAAKDKVSSLHSQAGKDKRVMEEDY